MSLPPMPPAAVHRSRSARSQYGALARRLVVLAGACALATGCNPEEDAGSSSSSPDLAAGSAPGAQATIGPPRDACELIPAEHVEAIVGAPVITASDPGLRESTCLYTEPSGRFPYLQLTVHWSGGREMLSIVQMGTDIAARIMAEPGDEAVVDSLVRPGPVAGLGDVALFSDIMPSYVLTGDVLVELAMQFANAEHHFRPLASLALSRL